MSVVTAPEKRFGRTLRGRRRARALTLPRPGLYASAALASLILAALSLLLPSAPAYDPWAWIVWGREVAHLSLVTTGGPTWKPLPVLFTTAFAPLGSAAPDLWLVVARAGGLMAVALASVLAGRLAGGPAGLADGRAGGGSVGSRFSRAPGLVAGALAGVGLLTLYQFAGGVATGESEGLLVALCLLAILRFMDGALRQALAFGFAAALLRPEAWPFVALYGVWLWRRDAAVRVWIGAAFVAVGVLWFVPELWGSGTLTRGVQWAQYARDGSPAFARCPFCSEITGSAWPLLTMPLKVGLAVALVSSAFIGFRSSRSLLWVAGLGLVGVLEEAVLTQIGFSGSDRYLTAPLALLIVAGAVGWGRLLVLGRWRLSVALVGVAVALSVVAFGRGPHLGSQLTSARLEAKIRGGVGDAVSALGRRRVLACGAIQTNPSEAPLVAWTLGVPLTRTESAAGAVIVQSGSPSSAVLAPLAPRGYRLAASTPAVRVFVRGC